METEGKFFIIAYNHASFNCTFVNKDGLYNIGCHVVSLDVPVWAVLRVKLYLFITWNSFGWHMIIKISLLCKYMFKLKSYICNNNRPEGFIAEWYLAKESMTIVSKYLQGIETYV